MAPIVRIEANVVTADATNAGTDSTIYLGIAGREFALDTNGDNFERGDDEQFVLGEGSNVTDADYKDPRDPQLDTDDLDHYPTYIRMAPGGSNPAWLVERVWVVVNPDDDAIEFDNERLSNRSRRLWLHEPYGLSLYLTRS